MPDFDLEAFNPNNPATQIALLAQRVGGLNQDNKVLELRNEMLEDRIRTLETYLNKEKKDRINAAIDFMSNAEFMGKWTWKGLAALAGMAASLYTALKLWRS